MDRVLKRLLEVLEAVNLRYLIGSAIAFLVLFAEIYFWGSSHGWGFKDSSGSTVSFWSCLSFSVVTFTSLGFGDLVPVRASRLFAGVEVVLGLTIFGLAVAKLSSYKQSYLLNQIYARDVQGKLDQKHRESAQELINLSLKIGKHFAETRKRDLRGCPLQEPLRKCRIEIARG